MPKRFRFLQTGDLHVGRGRGKEGWGEGISLQRAGLMFDKLYETAKHQKCHAVLITGDIFDTKSVTLSERELVTEKLVKYAGRDGIPTFVISGNHDLTAPGESNLDYLAVISECGEIPKLRVAPASEFRLWEAAPGLVVVGAPVGLSEHQDAVETIVKTLDPNTQYVFMGHGTIRGCVRNDSNWRESEAKDAKRLSLSAAAQMAPNVIWWAYGDIHKRQPLPTLPSTAKGWYAGTPIQMDFGETADRGVLIVVLDETPEGWQYAGRRYVRIDVPGAGFDELVTVMTEDQIDGLPKEALLRLAPGLVLPTWRHEQVIKTYRIVNDWSTPQLLAAINAGEPSAPTNAGTSQLQVFDPLLSDLSTVESQVLTGMPHGDDPVVAAEGKRVVGQAIERFRNRSYMS